MREKLTKDRVIDAAIAIADDGGLEAISMRRVGEQLAVEAMALYRHVSNKDELVNSMVERVAARFSVPPTETGWKGALRASGIAAYEVLKEHPWASAPLASRGHVGPERLRYVDAVLDRLREGGLSVQLAHYALHAYDGHVMGSMHRQARNDGEADAGVEVAALRAGELSAQYPRIAESMTEAVHDEDAEFELILDLILDGFDRLAQAGPSRP
ncbi:TetR family transcriptional regulator [Agromyces fucosus]|jgi:AcrR family transcriptional regulator|uniref:TetR family transcriptional regulator n=1 Tax=Agromyces fucosus TaxID=41985 RepID=A0A4Q2JKN5_9MICO|nr:TetR family transcriptional regulator [Agromyces fucosus]